MAEASRYQARRLWGGIWVGVLLIGIGILFYLQSAGIIANIWPGVLVLVGILILIGGIIRWASGRKIKTPGG